MEIKNVTDFEKAIRAGGYDQPGIAEGYEKITDKFFPERQREAEELIGLIPEELELAGGKKVPLSECKAVDLGCGPGLITDNLAPKVKEIVAIDTASEMVGYLKKKYKDQKAISAARADMTEIPLADESVEIVISSGAIFELPADGQSDEKFLGEVMRILKAGGILILDSVSNANYYNKINESHSKRNFSGQRAEDIKNATQSDSAVKQRKRVFLDSELAGQLKSFGYDCDVESFFNKDHEPICAVKITKKNNLKK